MSAYRPLGPFPQYFLADGTVNNGGLIHFYQTDLTTLQDTWSDMGLTVLNANPVVLDASGRPTTDIWGSAAYGVVITDSLGANPRTLNNIQPESGGGSTIPALVNGDFLTNNGSVLLWQAIAQLPDPTGHAGQILFTDGTLDYWGAFPTPPTPPSPDIVVTANSFQGGISSNTSKFVIMMGSDSAPATGSPTTSKSVTFPAAFTTLMGVCPSITSTSYNTIGMYAATGVTGKSTTGFTFNCNVSAHQGGSGSDANIIAPVPFDWIAFGFLTVA